MAIRLTIDKSNVVCNPPDPFCQEIGVMEISATQLTADPVSGESSGEVYKYSYAKPTAVEPDPNPWNAAAQYMVDTSQAGSCFTSPSKDEWQDTYWMGPGTWVGLQPG